MDDSKESEAASGARGKRVRVVRRWSWRGRVGERRTRNGAGAGFSREAGAAAVRERREAEMEEDAIAAMVEEEWREGG